MKRGALGLAAIIALTAIGACQEDLTTPVACPELCPGNSPAVRDTVIEALTGMDSSYTGYIGAKEITALLLSNNGFAPGQARPWATFPKRADSITVDGNLVELHVDSLTLVFNVVGLNRAVTGTKLRVHRISPFMDTLTTFGEVDAQLTPESIIGEATVTDTGTARLLFTGDDIHRLDVFEADSFRLGLGLSLVSDQPTGIRVASLFGSSRPPTIITYARVEVTDTAHRKQVLGLAADEANYVIVPPPLPSPDLIFLGGKTGSRAIIRFPRPDALKDSATILRATLELTPVGPVLGLTGDPGSFEVRGVLADLGKKSAYIASSRASGPISVGAADVLSVDVRDVVDVWFTTDPPPASIFVGITPEGGSFSFPVFHSSRSAFGRPRLRITYSLPARPGHP